MTEIKFIINLENDNTHEHEVTVNRLLTTEEKGKIIMQFCSTISNAGYLHTVVEGKEFKHYPPKEIRSIDVQVEDKSVILASGLVAA